MKENDFFNNISAFLKRAIDILFVLNPERSSLGVLFGFVLDGFIEIMKPFLINYSNTIDFSNIGQFKLILFGVFLFNIPVLITKGKLPKDIEMALYFIRSAKEESKLSKVQIKQMYINLFQKVLANVNLNEEIKRQIE